MQGKSSGLTVGPSMYIPALLIFMQDQSEETVRIFFDTFWYTSCIQKGICSLVNQVNIARLEMEQSIFHRTITYTLIKSKFCSDINWINIALFSKYCKIKYCKIKCYFDSHSTTCHFIEHCYTFIY